MRERSQPTEKRQGRPRSSPSPVRRPPLVTILSTLMTVFVFKHLLSMTLVIINGQLLQQLPLRVSPYYLVGFDMIWAAAGGILSWGLWKGRSWARTAGNLLALLYSAALWADLAWARAPEMFRTRWPITLIINLLGLSLVFFTLNTSRGRRYFSSNPRST